MDQGQPPSLRRRRRQRAVAILRIGCPPRALAERHSVSRLHPRHVGPLLQTCLPAEAPQEVALLAARPSIGTCARPIVFSSPPRRRSGSPKRASGCIAGILTSFPTAQKARSDDPETLKQAFFEKCPQVKGKRYLLFLGRIHRKKGCDMLIDAFAKVAASDPDLHLVMAGPDQQQWSVELQADRRQGRHRGPHSLARHDDGRRQVGSLLCSRGLHPALAPGELRHCRCRGHGLRNAGPALRQSQHRRRDRRRRRRADGTGYARRNAASAPTLDRNAAARAQQMAEQACAASISVTISQQTAKTIIQIFETALQTLKAEDS